VRAQHLSAAARAAVQAMVVDEEVHSPTPVAPLAWRPGCVWSVRTLNAFRCHPCTRCTPPPPSFPFPFLLGALPSSPPAQPAGRHSPRLGLFNGSFRARQRQRPARNLRRGGARARTPRAPTSLNAHEPNAQAAAPPFLPRPLHLPLFVVFSFFSVMRARFVGFIYFTRAGVRAPPRRRSRRPRRPRRIQAPGHVTCRLSGERPRPGGGFRGGGSA
jgi:hypothetical protein